MIHEAAVFLMADEAAMSAFGCIRQENHDSKLPPVYDMPGADQPLPLRQVLGHAAYDEAWIPDMLAGAVMDEVGCDRFDGDLLGDGPDGNLVRCGYRRASRGVTAAAAQMWRLTEIYRSPVAVASRRRTGR
jgi:hypothetical protein